MTTRPFLFVRHGPGLADALRLWVVAGGPGASLERASAQFVSWCSEHGLVKPSARFEGPAALWCARGWKAKGAIAEARHAELDALLLEVHRTTPLALVLRENTVSGSAWHDETMAALTAVFDALEQLATLPGPYAKPQPRDPGRAARGKADQRDVLLAWARCRVPAELFEAALGILRKSASTADRRAVLHDLQLERLPAMLGRDFDLDVMLREALASEDRLSATSVRMSQAFTEEVGRRTAERHKAASFRLKPEGETDWSSKPAVEAALAAKQWKQLEAGFEDTEQVHVELLLSLPAAVRAELARHGHFSTRIANAAALRTMAGEFAPALALYDAALGGALDPMAAANLLFAVQNDNNHLGLDPARSRRYLRRCLPHAPRNPTIWLNAAFVFMELKEHGEALRVLALAKAAGVPVKPHQNEALFEPLRGLPAFKQLLR